MDKKVRVIAIPSISVRLHFYFFTTTHVVLVTFWFYLVLDKLFGMYGYVDVAKVVKG